MGAQGGGQCGLRVRAQSVRRERVLGDGWESGINYMPPDRCQDTHRAPRHTLLQPASPHAGTHSSGHRTQQHSKDGQESLLPSPEDCVIPEPGRGCRKVLSTGTGTQNTPSWERVSQALEGKQMGLLGGGIKLIFKKGGWALGVPIASQTLSLQPCSDHTLSSVLAQIHRGKKKPGTPKKSG